MTLAPPRSSTAPPMTTDLADRDCCAGEDASTDRSRAAATASHRQNFKNSRDTAALYGSIGDQAALGLRAEGLRLQAEALAENRLYVAPSATAAADALRLSPHGAR